MPATRTTVLSALMALAVLALGGCADGGLVKPGASEAEIERDRAECRQLALGPARRPSPPPAPTFTADGRPEGRLHADTTIGNAQMNDVLDRMSVDPATFENCLRARGFRDP